MENFLCGILGGIIPAAVIILLHFITLSGRLARIETNISWIIRELKKCPPHLKNRLA
jgi:hypothetical protein